MVDVKEPTTAETSLADSKIADCDEYATFVERYECDRHTETQKTLKGTLKEIKDYETLISNMRAQISLLTGKLSEANEEIGSAKQERDQAIGERFMLLLQQKEEKEDLPVTKLKPRKSSDSGKWSTQKVLKQSNSATAWKLNSPLYKNGNGEKKVFDFNNKSVFGSTRHARQGYDLNQSMTAEEQLNANYIETLRLNNRKIEEKTLGYKFGYAQVKATNESVKDDLEEALKTYQGLQKSIQEEDLVIQHVRKSLAEVVPDVKTLEMIAKKTRSDVTSKTLISARGSDMMSPRNGGHNITVDNIQIKEGKSSPLAKLSNFIGRFTNRGSIMKLRSQTTSEY